MTSPMPAPKLPEDPLALELMRANAERQNRIIEASFDEKEQALACSACGCLEGEVHEFGCEMERCPFCGGQLASCGCGHERLGLAPGAELTRAQSRSLARTLRRRGRVPWVFWPLLCSRCGARHPALCRHRVGAAAWDRYVQIDERDAWLCKECYGRIKDVVDERSRWP